MITSHVWRFHENSLMKGMVVTCSLSREYHAEYLRISCQELYLLTLKFNILYVHDTPTLTRDYFSMKCVLNSICPVSCKPLCCVHVVFTASEDKEVICSHPLLMPFGNLSLEQ